MTYGTANIDKFVSSDGGVISPNITSLRNRIINGAMVISQRTTSATAGDGNYPSIDRYQTFTQAGDGAFTVAQVADAPSGYTYSAKLTVTTADASITSGQRYLFLQNIEGFNAADLGFGAAGASSVTVSFWVKSSLTGAFGGCLCNSPFDRTYPFSYTINAANTWEQKTVTITGDTTGTWYKDNTVGMRLVFCVGTNSGNMGTANAWSSTTYWQPTGSTNLIATLNATLQITGVQLEKGSTATSFDYRPYGTELALCQRYLPAISYSGGSNPYFGAGMAFGTTSAYYTVSLPVTPRVSPTGLTVSAASHFAGFLATTATSNATGVVFGGANSHSAFIQLTGMVGLVGGNASLIYMSNSAALMTFTGCEL